MIRHKLNEFTNKIACGKDPDRAVYADSWEFTTCKGCIAKKGKIAYHPHHRARPKIKKKRSPLWRLIGADYLKGRENKVRKSLFNKFKTKEPKKIPFGDTFNMRRYK